MVGIANELAGNHIVYETSAGDAGPPMVKASHDVIKMGSVGYPVIDGFHHKIIAGFAVGDGYQHAQIPKVPCQLKSAGLVDAESTSRTWPWLAFQN